MTDNTSWVDDPTVYAPYRVHVELAAQTLDRPADHVTLTPEFVFVRDPRGNSLNIPVEDVRQIRVVVADRPADYARLREDHPRAYDPWDRFTLGRVEAAARSSTTLATLAAATGRPPEHLVHKARELGHAVPEDGSADDAATLISDWFADNHYLVHVGARGRPAPRVVDVLARHNVLLPDVYRISSWGFAAQMPADQAERLAADPDVIEVEPDTVERLAPHHRMPAESRVPGMYIVGVRRTSRPETVAARAGVVPECVLDVLNAFGAILTDTQLDALRRDPEVSDIEDDAVITLDD